MLLPFSLSVIYRIWIRDCNLSHLNTLTVLIRSYLVAENGIIEMECGLRIWNADYADYTDLHG